MPRATRPSPPSFSLANTKTVSPSGDMLAAIHRLLCRERERPRAWIANLGFDSEHYRVLSPSNHRLHQKDPKSATIQAAPAMTEGQREFGPVHMRLWVSDQDRDPNQHTKEYRPSRAIKRIASRA